MELKDVVAWLNDLKVILAIVLESWGWENLFLFGFFSGL